MDDLLDLTRLIASGFVAGGIIYAIYRGLRWRFPRLGKWRARLVVVLGAVFLASLSHSMLRTGGVGCVQHENTVLLRGERVMNIRERDAMPPTPMTPERSARIRNSCSYLARYCPLDPTDPTRAEAAERCLMMTPETKIN